MSPSTEIQLFTSTAQHIYKNKTKVYQLTHRVPVLFESSLNSVFRQHLLLVKKFSENIYVECHGNWRYG